MVAAFRKQLIGVTAMLIALPLGAAMAFSAAHLARPDAPLQRLADEAALAAVDALAASRGQPDATRIAASTEAASQVVSGQPAIIQSIKPSSKAMRVAVVLTDPGHRAVSSAIAHYVAPSEGYAPQESAALSNQ